MQRSERWAKINNSEYNKWYKKIKGMRIPGYLKKGWGESRWRRAARFRLGKDERKYWEEEKGKKCKLCNRRKECMKACMRGLQGMEEWRRSLAGENRVNVEQRREGREMDKRSEGGEKRRGREKGGSRGRKEGRVRD